MYKIYKYTNNISKKIYIGQTSRSLKERSGSNGRNYRECPDFYNAIQEFGWDNFSVEILEDNIENLDDANSLEEKWIQRLNATDPSIGYNLRPGGAKFMSSDQSRKRISDGLKRSKVFLKNNFDAHAKAVIGIDTTTWEIREFDSATSAANITGFSRGNISSCCRGTKGNLTIGGYMWIFKSNFISIEYHKKYFYDRRKEQYGDARNKKMGESLHKLYSENKNILEKCRKKVIRIDPSDMTETEYESVREAAEKNNIKAPTNITYVCNGQRKSAAGYYWKWKK